MLTKTEADKLFTYTGTILLWKTPGPKRNVGRAAGHTDKAGYTRIMVGGKMYLAHRLIWLMSYGTWPENHIDHVDGNPANNRLENLRDVSRSVNMRNAKAKTDNVVGIRGINFVANRQNSYHLRLQGKFLGAFKTLEEAKEAKNRYEQTNPY